MTFLIKISENSELPFHILKGCSYHSENMALVRADVPQKYKDRSWSGFFKKETWIFGAGNRQPNKHCTWLLYGEAFRSEWGGTEVSFLGRKGSFKPKMCLLTAVLANTQKDSLTLLFQLVESTCLTECFHWAAYIINRGTKNMSGAAKHSLSNQLTSSIKKF